MEQVPDVVEDEEVTQDTVQHVPPQSQQTNVDETKR